MNNATKATTRLAAVVGLEVEATPAGYAVTVLRFNLGEVSDENFALIRAFPQLRRLELVETWDITPRGLVHLEAVPVLEELNLCNSSAAEDEGMVYVGRLAALRVLHLNANSITDLGLEALAGLSKLEWLHLEHNPITDRGLCHLRRMTQLRWLDLSCPAVSNAGLDQLLALSELEHLALCGTAVSDDAIPVLNTCRSLYFFPGISG